MADLEEARAAKSRLRSLLAGRSGIGGIGISRDGDGQGYGLQVNLTETVARDLVPPQVDGVRVHIRQTGQIRPQL